MKQIIRFIRNEEGSGLVLSLMVLIVLSVLGLSLGMVTVGSHKLSDINRDHTSAYYVAEAGANIAYENIKSQVEKIAIDEEQSGYAFIGQVDSFVTSSQVEYSGEKYFRQQSGDTPKALIVVDKGNEPIQEDNVYTKEYLIESIGSVDNKTRIVTKPFTVSWREKLPENSHDNSLGLPKEAALIIKENADFKNKSLITGGIFGAEGATRTGKIENIPEFIKFNIDWDVVSTYVKSIPSDTILLSEYGYKELTTANSKGGNINIDTEQQTINYIVDPQFFKNNFLTISGGGTVNIVLSRPFTSSDFQGGGNSKITQSVNGLLNIIYRGDKEMTIPNGVKGDYVLLSPNAHVNLGQGATIRGSVIAKSIEMYNGSEINYPKDMKYNFPLGSKNNPDEEDDIDLIKSSPAIEQ